MSDKYTAEQIQYKEGIEHVRTRPGMYVDNQGEKGLHRLVWEVIDNSIDEALAGHCNKIKITVKQDNIIEVEDDGRGIPVDTHSELGISALELVMTKIGAGGKFNKDVYKISGGLHGVGVSVVNALSEWTEVYSYRDEKVYYQKYFRGIPEEPVKVVGETDKHGTKTLFKPDAEIFETTTFVYEQLTTRCRELAFLNKGIEIHLSDERDEDEIKHNVFKFEGGIVSFIQLLHQNKDVINKEPIYIEGSQENIEVEIALAYNTGYNERIFCYTNNINNIEGGTHLSGFRSGLTRIANETVKNFKYEKKIKNSLEGDDVREGLTAVISVKVPEPQFGGQTKTKLGNTGVRGIVETVVKESLSHYFETHPDETKKILDKYVISHNARRAAQLKREAVRKGFLDRDTLPGKLADCSETNPENCEIYLVEGDSAGGSAKQGRDRKFQAILPLWGKMLNVEKTRIDKVLDNDKLQPIIAALGTNIGQNFDYNKLRYHKIIIMADADVDGSHIRTLLLTFFYRYFPDIVEKGHIYIAMPPLYKIQNGKQINYAYNEDERKSIMKSFGEKKVSLQRYKGLGEMNPEQLWETTMNPAKRNIIRITLEDTILADEIFSILMGDSVEPRREFIEKHAARVKNLDV